VLILEANSPIGVFDSGIGGLTVAKALVDALPNESVIYFGDTAHLPYGDKSKSTIQGYAKKIVDFLLARHVKLILIACNSASAAAYEGLKTYIGSQALLVNVIDPVVNFLSKSYSGKRIGLIGTKITVNSGIYHQKLLEQRSKVELCALATPLLVPIIEEGFFEHQIMDVALSLYLSNHVLQDISALVLGCTHYPVIKSKIANFYQGKIDIVDAANIVTQAVQTELASSKMLSSATPERLFYVSDYTENFAHRTRLFFGQAVSVKAVNLF